MKLFALKRELKQKLTDNDLNGIAQLARRDRRVINILMSFSYDKETVLSWRAIKAVGISAAIMLEREYEFMRDTTRRLIWSVTEESGNVAWSSVEMLSEIVASDVDRFRDLIPIIVSLYDEEIFKEGVMYGLSRIADESAEEIRPFVKVVHEALHDSNPRVRYFALDCIKKADLEIPKDVISGFREDRSTAWIYNGEKMEEIEVGLLLAGS
jgi:hypothetical protein